MSIGVALLAVVFAVITVAGIRLSIEAFAGEFPLPPYIGLLVVMCTTFAGVTAVGLFRSRDWGLHGLRAWAATFALLVVLIYLMFREPPPGGPFGAVVLLLAAGFAYWMIDRYVRSRILGSP